MYIVMFAQESCTLFTRWDWLCLVELADLGGWRPQDPEARALVMGSRYSRDGAPPGVREELFVEVSRSDSFLLADALEHVLLDIPNHDCAEEKAPAIKHASGAVAERLLMPGESLSVLEDLSGPRKALVREWVEAFRDGGGFTVKNLGHDGARRGWWEAPD